MLQDLSVENARGAVLIGLSVGQMGQCAQCTSRVKKARDTYALADQLYDIDEAGVMKTALLGRDLSLQGLRQSIHNSVKYHLVTPRFFVPGIDQLTKEVLNTLTLKLRISAIAFVTYSDLPGIKDSPRTRNVFFHIVQTPEDIKTAETPLFDVFICLDTKYVPQEIKEQYLIEQVDRFAILTKQAQYQETQEAPQ